MLETKRREEIVSLIKREVVPAIGCTEPVAVALCVAKATELLGMEPRRIEIGLSGNMLKNAMGVGIPGTGMIGLPIAVALGALVGKSAYGLEVLKDVTPEAVERGKRFIKDDRISISLSENTPSNLYIDVKVSDGEGHEARAIISGSHTNFIYLNDGNQTLCDLRGEVSGSSESKADSCELNLATVYEFATTTPLDEISFILEARKLNKRAAEIALSGEYGHCLGSTIRTAGCSLFGDSPLNT